MGLSNANNIIIINKYFKKRVGAAYGLLLTGFGLGGLAMPQVYVWINQTTRPQVILRDCVIRLELPKSFMMQIVDGRFGPPPPTSWTCIEDCRAAFMMQIVGHQIPSPSWICIGACLATFMIYTYNANFCYHQITDSQTIGNKKRNNQPLGKK